MLKKDFDLPNKFEMIVPGRIQHNPTFSSIDCLIITKNWRNKL